VIASVTRSGRIVNSQQNIVESWLLTIVWQWWQWQPTGRTVGLDVHARSVVACGVRPGRCSSAGWPRSTEAPAFLPSARSWARAGRLLIRVVFGSYCVKRI